MKNFLLRPLFLLILFFILPQPTKCQTITGKILNAADSTAIAYVTIGIPSLCIGTITNQAGQFAFYNTISTSDSVNISHLAYEKKWVPSTSDIKDTIIYLKPLVSELHEVTIIPHDSIIFWFRKAVDRIKENYPRKLHFYDAFYREARYDIKSMEYTRLVEADVLVQDRSYRQALENVKIKVNQMRKSDDQARKSLYQEAMEYLFGEINYLNSVVSKNPVRTYYPYKHNNLSNEILKAVEMPKNLHLENIIKGKSKILVMNWLSKGLNTSQRIFFYIDKKDFAFLKLTSDSYMSGNLVSSETFEFHKVDDVYLPAFFRKTSISGLRAKSQQNALEYSENILLVNHYYHKKEIEKIRNRLAADKSQDFYKEKYTYDPDFWNHYNLLLREPLKEKVVDDLSVKTSLEKQYKNNGNN